MTEVVETAVAALQATARDAREAGVILTFVQLLSSGKANLERVSVGVLCELAVDKEGIGMIEAEQANAPLTARIAPTTR